MEHIKFPSINQFRNVVAHVRRKAQYRGIDATGEPILDRTAMAPTLGFLGTVKLHGTNAAIVFHAEDITYQSRERVLTREADNAGFMNYMADREPALLKLMQQIRMHANVQPDTEPTIAVYGEWCGGNIQKGVAISGLPKMFVIFAIKIHGEWVNEYVGDIKDEANGIYNIHQFSKWFALIDFERPEKAQDLLGRLTEKVEECCPVGKFFGVEGIGEGIVWRCIEDPSSDLWFKVKGEKHSASKVKTLAAVDVEAVAKVHDFVAMAVTEARLEQGLQNLQNEQLKPFDMTSMGDFLRWVHSDIAKEEADTIQASGLELKKLGGPITIAAKRWYVERLNAAVMA